MKIKVWHKKEKVMLYPPGKFSSSNNITLKGGENWIYKGEPAQALLTWNGLLYINGEVQDIEILKFTGLQDYQKRDIYAGDIYNTMKNRYVITYHNTFGGYYGIGLFYNQDIVPATYLLDSFYLGNIYENPEFLKI